jgi:hypothetical protein
MKRLSPASTRSQDARHDYSSRWLDAVGCRDLIRYALNHREGLVRFLEDGRIELDTAVFEKLSVAALLTSCASAACGQVVTCPHTHVYSRIGQARVALTAGPRSA